MYPVSVLQNRLVLEELPYQNPQVEAEGCILQNPLLPARWLPPVLMQIIPLYCEQRYTGSRTMVRLNNSTTCSRLVFKESNQRSREYTSNIFLNDCTV